MIPIKLDLQGLYSYKEKQTIDFATLTSAGLFGIFGAVGSGKSSILEAILLALYGNTERLAGRGEKTSMVNLQSDLLSITFEFKAGKNNSNTYKATYLARRNKRNYDDIRPADHHFYKKSADGWIPIAENGEAILGMKMDHFRQTVIIPQGKFRDFIEQKPLARAEMMKELFSLERFDLSAKTGALLKTTNESKIRLETQLGALEEIQPELQKEKERLLKDQLARTTAQEALLKQVEETYLRLSGLQEKYTRLIQLRQEEGMLLLQQPAINEKKQRLAAYRKALFSIGPILDQIRERKLEMEKYEVSFKECSRWKIEYERDIVNLEANEIKLKGDQARKGEREARIRDLNKIMEINLLEDRRSTNQQEVNQLLPVSEKTKTLILQMEAEIRTLEIKEDELNVPDAQELADLQTSLKEWKELGLDQKRIGEEIASLQEKIAAINQEVRELTSSIPENMTGFGEWIDELGGQLDKQQLQRERLIQKQGLMAYSAELNPGEKCPLCGSSDHPHPLADHFNNQELEQNAKLIQQSKTQLDQVRKTMGVWEKQILQLDTLQANLSAKSVESVNVVEKMEALVNELTTKEIKSQEELSDRLDQYARVIAEQQALTKQLRLLRQDLRTKKTAFDEDEKKLRKAEQELLALNATLATHKKEIKLPDFSFKYLEKTNDEIKKDIGVVQQAIDDLEINLQRNQDRLREARKNQATNLANLENSERLYSETKTKLAGMRDELQVRLIENGFADQQEAVSLLESTIEQDRWESEIKAFENQLEILRDRLRELEGDKEVVHFDLDLFQETAQSLQIEKETFEKLKAENTLLQNELESIKEKLVQKQSLSLELEKVERREMNLKDLDRLFKGNGFVKYMSGIYLRELCQTANLRFLKLTKNRLSLEIDEANNFWVQDYLNGGRKRLLKSLSGGQTFLASLCLSLALAEKVKSLNRADQSFFFLDEGFGALDKPSLRIVFEALKSLREEKRVVGIISHVEDLQQEIEVFAKVELDSERGSLVSYSF